MTIRLKIENLDARPDATVFVQAVDEIGNPVPGGASTFVTGGGSTESCVHFGQRLVISEPRERESGSDERMLQWFEYAHLPDRLQGVSRPFGELAKQMCRTLAKGPERTVALRKLLEAKDAAVRAALNPGA